MFVIAFPDVIEILSVSDFGVSIWFRRRLQKLERYRHESSEHDHFDNEFPIKSHGKQKKTSESLLLSGL